MKRLPVTVLSGYLGSGKTTLLKQVLTNRDRLKVAVIVNDMSEVNIDATEVASNVALSRLDEKLGEMSNGCICCTLRDDLLTEVRALATSGRFDYLLIKSTGISEPLSVAETFAFLDENGFCLSDVAQLDTMVTVVDGTSFLRNMQSTRVVARLAGDEVPPELWATCLWSKLSSRTSADQQGRPDFEAGLRGVGAGPTKTEPGCRILPLENGRMEPSEIVNARRFNMERAALSPGWLQACLQRNRYRYDDRKPPTKRRSRLDEGTYFRISIGGPQISLGSKQRPILPRRGQKFVQPLRMEWRSFEVVGIKPGFEQRDTLRPRQTLFTSDHETLSTFQETLRRQP